MGNKLREQRAFRFLQRCSVWQSAGTMYENEMTTDQELLRRYIDQESDEAFAELVRRHVNLVYGLALRQLCGNASLAGDVTQAVFTALALQRKEISQIRHLTAWLHATTRFTVSHTVRAERRRQEREQKAQVFHALMLEPETSDMPNLPPGLLDEVLAELDERDREAVLLRFFEEQPFSTIGSALEMSEDAARMRVTRALEQVRELFARKGIKSTAAAVSALLAQQVVAAPAHLAAGIATGALAGTAAVVASVGGAKLGFITLMTTTKTVWVAGAVAVLAVGYAGFQYRENAQRRDELVRLTQEWDALRAQLRDSEQRSAASAERAIQAQRERSELQHKLDGLLADKAKPQSMSQKQIAADAEKRAVDRRKMAQLKPQLEAGLPIKGAVVVTTDGKAVSYPVELVMGKEATVISDDGIYSLRPVLNPDGSITYEIRLAKETKIEDGRTTTRKTLLPMVRQIPWEGFTVILPGGAVLAFDSDLPEPK